MSNFTLSKHAVVRTAQRNVNKDALDIVLTYGVDIPAGAAISKRSLRVSQLQELYNDGFSVIAIEKAFNLMAVVSNDGVIITCYRIDRKICCRRKNSRYKSKRIRCLM